MQNYCRCYAVISLKAIAENIKNIKKLVSGDAKMLAVLKADAYGHGAVAVARHIEAQIDMIGVACPEEGLELREAGIKKPILILGYTSPLQYEAVVENDIMPTIYNYDEARKLSEAAVKQGKTADFNIAIDTGMSRIGFRVKEETADEIEKISKLSNIKIAGMFSHLSCADMYEDEYSLNQLEEYDEMTELLKKKGVNIPVRHICNSAGIMKYSDHHFECVRSGIITYGLYPSEEVDKNVLKLEPAMQWKTHVIHLQELEPGRGISYAATYMTEKPVTKIATLSVGYADGYPRTLSSKGYVLIRGKKAPIVGRVCMDIMMVDVSDIPDVEIEDIATLIGKDKDAEITVEEIAELAGSFNYETVCRVSKRVKRIYTEC